MTVASRNLPFGRLAVAVLIVGAMLVGLIAAGGESAAAAAAKPPCTKKALVAGLKRGTAKITRGRLIQPFSCAGRFAYSAVVVHGNEITVLFRAKGALWVTANRGKYCENGSVPRRIYKSACESN